MTLWCPGRWAGREPVLEAVAWDLPDPPSIFSLTLTSAGKGSPKREIIVSEWKLITTRGPGPVRSQLELKSIREHLSLSLSVKQAVTHTQSLYLVSLSLSLVPDVFVCVSCVFIYLSVCLWKRVWCVWCMCMCVVCECGDASADQPADKPNRRRKRYCRLI